MSHRHHDILPKPAAALFTLATLLLLAGCGSSDNSGVRLFNVSQDYTSLNVYVGSTATTPSIGNVPTGSLSSYVGIDPGSNTVYFTEGANTQSDPLTSQSETFSSGEHRTTSQQLYSQSPVTLSSQGIYTLFMFGSASSPNGVLNQDR